MSSSWNVYYVIFLSALLALAIPAMLMAVSRIASAKKSPKPLRIDVLGEVPRRDLTSLGSRMNTRVFLGVNAALALMCIFLVLIPCVGVIKSGSPSDEAVRALLVIISLAVIASLGLFYAAKKGDLSWLRSFQKREP